MSFSFTTSPHTRPEAGVRMVTAASPHRAGKPCDLLGTTHTGQALTAIRAIRGCHENHRVTATSHLSQAGETNVRVLNSYRHF